MSARTAPLSWDECQASAVRPAARARSPLSLQVGRRLQRTQPAPPHLLHRPRCVDHLKVFRASRAPLSVAAYRRVVGNGYVECVSPAPTVAVATVRSARGASTDAAGSRSTEAPLPAAGAGQRPYSVPMRALQPMCPWTQPGPSQNKTAIRPAACRAHCRPVLRAAGDRRFRLRRPGHRRPRTRACIHRGSTQGRRAE